MIPMQSKGYLLIYYNESKQSISQQTTKHQTVCYLLRSIMLVFLSNRSRNSNISPQTCLFNDDGLNKICVIEYSTI